MLSLLDRRTLAPPAYFRLAPDISDVSDADAELLSVSLVIPTQRDRKSVV